ncbi:MAG: hypothetical protein J3Q66DRAFT_330371 [Benniella sp.]|nr:MAG: hypothetical protein J3Q66DRAFT_330371 [Benniella sp.]
MSAILHFEGYPTGTAIHNASALQDWRKSDNSATATRRSPSSNAASTMPPELIHLIVNYLDKRDLVKVLTLNWTWANTVAPKLWQEVNYTSAASWIVFLITKSVPPPSPDQSFAEAAAAATATTATRSGANAPRATSGTAASSSSWHAGASSQDPSTSGHPAPRRNSYPWPTLLPYHSMVHSLRVSLSSGDMVKDLLDVIPCCIELRSFFIECAIPTEELLIRGVVASACNDLVDPMHGGHLHTSSSTSSLSSAASTTPSMSQRLCPPSCSIEHSHTFSLMIDPSYRTAIPRAGIQEMDEETIMASSTSQSGQLFKLLANSCPKLEKVWVSGFQPVSVLGAPTDLRPRARSGGMQSSGLKTTTIQEAGSQQKVGSSTAQLPPILPVPGMNTAVASTLPPSMSAGLTSLSSQSLHSRIQSLQFVNCTLPPQYLVTMIQHSLPNLTVLHLTQCWYGQPIRSGFLDNLGKACPGLKELTLHSTQSHRGVVTSGDMLKLLKRLEAGGTFDTTTQGGEGRGGDLADFPLGALAGRSYGAPSISSTAATTGTSTISNSYSSTSSALATLPSSVSSTSSLHSGSINSSMGGGGGPYYQSQLLASSQSVNSYHDDQENDDEISYSSHKSASALESISVWFPQSILDSEIIAELADKERHPKLKQVDFGSDDSFAQGLQLIRSLHQQRSDLTMCAWIEYGPTWDDRED